MTHRLVWFLVFISAIIAVAGISSYRDSFHSNTRVVKILSFNQEGETEVKAKEPEVVVDEIAIAKELYVSAQCIRCHGANGEGVQAEEGPMLAAQHGWYLYDQMQQIRDGKRVNEKMLPFVKDLTDQDFKRLSKYISALRVQ